MNAMTPEQMTALRALAQAATQPGSAFGGQFWDFHHAVTPAAVLALLDDVERMQEALRGCLERMDGVECHEESLWGKARSTARAALEPRA